MLNAQEVYKVALETWKFQVNSYWTRNSYFAAFETALTFGVWKVSETHPSAGFGFAIVGLLLTTVWFLNNDRLHEYIVFYWERSIALERLALADAAKEEHQETQHLFLVSGFDEWRSKRTNHHPKFRINYSDIVQFVPLLFLVAWMIIIAFNSKHIWCTHH